MTRIEKSESFIRSITGVRELGVRDHGNLAGIEVGSDERQLFFNGDVLDTIGAALREFVFTYVSLDIVGYRSGSMNEQLRNSLQ